MLVFAWSKESSSFIYGKGKTTCTTFISMRGSYLWYRGNNFLEKTVWREIQISWDLTKFGWKVFEFWMEILEVRNILFPKFHSSSSFGKSGDLNSPLEHILSLILKTTMVFFGKGNAKQSSCSEREEVAMLQESNLLCRIIWKSGFLVRKNASLRPCILQRNFWNDLQCSESGNWCMLMHTHTHTHTCSNNWHQEIWN